jgi:hypothetical protein
VTTVVISECFGGFGLSPEAAERMKELGWDGRSHHDIDRDDPRLVQVVTELGGDRASGEFAELRVVQIPNGVKWHVHEYDGLETIHEAHRSWTSFGENRQLCGE